MNEFHVSFAGYGNEVTVQGGTVSDACTLAGHPLDLVCGGNGICGKCDTLVERHGIRETVRACITPVDCDMTVYLSGAPDSAQILTNSEAVEHFEPLIRKEFIPAQELSPIHCGAFLKDAPLNVLRSFSRLSRENGVTYVRFGDKLLDVQAGDTSGTLYGCATDIGTTTVAMYIYDLCTGTLLSTVSALNGQTAHGADVIARIQYTQDSATGLKEMQSAIIGTINGLIAKAEESVPGLSENLYHMVFCGNSTMQHLFLGLNPAALGVDPFANITADPVTCRAGDLGLKAPADAAVDFLPLLGGFVGADTASVLLGVPQDDGVYLMVDLGTNGEIAMGNGKKGFLTASTACGPALEGGCIECGMRGTAGAVDKLKILPDGTVDYHVLGGTEACGLCGSGIIDAVAELLRSGIVDETGRMLSSAEYAEAHPGSPLVSRLGNISEYDPAFFITRGDHPVFISQNDVRQIQLAKSSICAGCMTLASEYGIALEDLDALIIAGAFGTFINMENALYIGLLPPIAPEKIRSVGNGAGQGVQHCLLDRHSRDRADAIRNMSGHVELNCSPTFMDNYIMQMSFYI